MVSKWLRRTSIRRTVFTALVLLLTTTVGWLGWRVLAQDEQLASQRVADDREIAADLVVATLEQRLSALERDLDTALAGGQLDRPAPATGEVLIRLTVAAVDALPKNRLRYLPHLSPRSAPPEAEA